MTISEKIELRGTANRCILLILLKVWKVFPDWRFEQLICNLGLGGHDGEDKFYVESIDTLNMLINNPIVYPIISPILTQIMQDIGLED